MADGVVYSSFEALRSQIYHLGRERATKRENGDFGLINHHKIAKINGGRYLVHTTSHYNRKTNRWDNISPEIIESMRAEKKELSELIDLSVDIARGTSLRGIVIVDLPRRKGD